MEYKKKKQKKYGEKKIVPIYIESCIENDLMSKFGELCWNISYARS